MGQKNNNDKNKKLESNKESSVTILTSGCHFQGKLFCRGSTRIGGRADGEIVSEGVLIIEADAVVNANIESEEIIIHGEVEGRIDAKVRLEFSPSSRFRGEIFTPVLVVREGAQFNGISVMESEVSSGSVIILSKEKFGDTNTGKKTPASGLEMKVSA